VIALRVFVTAALVLAVLTGCWAGGYLHDIALATWANTITIILWMVREKL
jgi:hypothetical protein